MDTRYFDLTGRIKLSLFLRNRSDLHCLILLVWLGSSVVPAAAYREDYEAFAESLLGRSFEASSLLDFDDLIPEEDRGRGFAPDLARQQILSDERPNSPAIEFIESRKHRENEARGERLADDPLLYEQVDRLCEAVGTDCVAAPTELADQENDEDELEATAASLQEVTTKLAVFESIDQQINQSDFLEVSKIQLFKGKIYRCSKNVAGKLLYDCCFGTKGLAESMALTHCNAEEIELADKRERGQSHYVGRRSKRIAGLWKSRDEYSFCCFDSKLSRVFQEQARLQLNLGWGSAKRPDCRGLYAHEIKDLDFGRLDLSEVYEDSAIYSDIEMNEMVEGFAERTATRMREHCDE